MVDASLEALERLDVRIKPYVQCLLTELHHKLSFTEDPILITDPSRGYLPQHDEELKDCDRFKVKIPYAQRVLTWELIFDSGNFKDAPDIIFDAEDDNFCPPWKEIQSLIGWNWKKVESLVLVLSDLLERYKGFQLARASAHNSLQRHISSLLSEDPGQFQLYIYKEQKSLGRVNVLVKLDVNFSDLPPYLIQENPGPDTAIVSVNYSHPESSSPQCKLILSPRVEKVLSAPVKVPSYRQHMLLGEYVSEVKRFINQLVKNVVQKFDKKKEAIAAFLSHFGTAVLEYDAQSFSYIYCLFEWNDFFFIFKVELPSNFPDRPPVISFRSIYHMKKPGYHTSHSAAVHSHTFQTFSYQSQWDGNELTRKISEFILKNIKEFHESSVNL